MAHPTYYELMKIGNETSHNQRLNFYQNNFLENSLLVESFETVHIPSLDPQQQQRAKIEIKIAVV